MWLHVTAVRGRNYYKMECRWLNVRSERRVAEVVSATDEQQYVKLHGINQGTTANVSERCTLYCIDYGKRWSVQKPLSALNKNGCL